LTNITSVFEHARPFTIGVEEEYMLCDPETGDLVNRANEFMAALPEDAKRRFSYELMLSEIESNTPVCGTVSEAVGEIIKLRSLVKTLGEELGYKIGISGTHPAALPGTQTYVDTTGYNWVTDQMRAYADQNMTFATHVHVAIPGAETAIHVCNALRRWIPPLLAISVNSPFFAGKNTGLLSARTFQFGIFPRTNIPMRFKNFAEYEKLVELWTKTGTIAKPRHVWWKIRPSLDFGTLEFRIFDALRSLKNLELIIAISQALIYQLVQDLQKGSLPEELSPELLSDGLWKAARFDFDTSLVDTATLDVLTMRDFIKRLGEYCKPALHHFENEKVIDTLEDILNNGTEASEQLAEFKAGDMTSLKLFLMDSVDFSYND